MKKFIIILAAITCLTGYRINEAQAHPGNTDKYGCHTCRTNCSRWGLRNGEYHCHNKKSLPQPKAPIKSKLLW